VTAFATKPLHAAVDGDDVPDVTSTVPAEAQHPSPEIASAQWVTGP